MIKGNIKTPIERLLFTPNKGASKPIDVDIININKPNIPVKIMVMKIKKANIVSVSFV